MAKSLDRLRQVQWIVVAVATMFVLMIVLSMYGLIHQQKQVALSTAQLQASRMATSAAAALNRTLVDLDVLLTNLNETQTALSPADPGTQAEKLAHNMRSMVQHTLILRRLVITDARGKVLAASDMVPQATLNLPAGFAERAMTPIVPELLLSDPVLSFTGAEASVFLARHLRSGQGSKLLAVAEVSITQLATIISQGADLNQLEITLERSNGLLLASMPAQDRLLGQRIAPELQQGETDQAFLGQSRLSQKEAVLAVKPALHDELALVVSIPTETALNKWRTERNFILLMGALFIAMVLGIAGLGIWYLRRLAVARNAIQASQAEVEQLAFHDHLTNLPNRLLLTERLSHALTSSIRHQRYGVLLFMDLDNFKNLNDTRGHDVGDLLLKQVAQRLISTVRAQDTVARLGGDEFVIMLEELAETPTEAAEIARRIGEKLLSALNQPYIFDGQSHKSSASLGAALFGGEPVMPAELLKQADIAMYQAKARGRNGLCFFDPQMQEAISARADMETDLLQALEQQQFMLYYQAQVGQDGQVVGAEVLIRWRHPERGMVPPAEFIPLAEESELINQIGAWVLHTACAQLHCWQQNPATQHLQLSVNVSARQFRQADFVKQVQFTVAQHRIQPQGLKLELTESLVLSNVDDTIAKMGALKALGVRFSMDDFGTGHSSLSYLTRLPLDQLKIDQSFVRNIGLKTTDGIIVQTIIGMASNLGLEVIAEGVETTAQLHYLASHGCFLYQGYLFGKPAPLPEFETMLDTPRTTTDHFAA